MREICTYGLEGGVAHPGHPYPYRLTLPSGPVGRDSGEPFLGVGIGIGIGIEGGWGSIPMAIPTPTPMSWGLKSGILSGS